MRLDLSSIRTLLLEVPRHGKLAYCLLRDPRVPVPPKVALLATLGLIVSPLDLPGWIPVVGDFDMLALAVLAVKVFVESCPDALVEEHRRSLDAGESTFDQDVREAVRLTTGGLRQVTSRISGVVVAARRYRSLEDTTA